jgi:hypothetical protein
MILQTNDDGTTQVDTSGDAGTAAPIVVTTSGSASVAANATAAGNTAGTLPTGSTNQAANQFTETPGQVIASYGPFFAPRWLIAGGVGFLLGLLF